MQASLLILFILCITEIAASPIKVVSPQKSLDNECQEIDSNQEIAYSEIIDPLGKRRIGSSSGGRSSGGRSSSGSSSHYSSGGSSSHYSSGGGSGSSTKGNPSSGDNTDSSSSGSTGKKGGSSSGSNTGSGSSSGSRAGSSVNSYTYRCGLFQGRRTCGYGSYYAPTAAAAAAGYGTARYHGSTNVTSTSHGESSSSLASGEISSATSSKAGGVGIFIPSHGSLFVMSALAFI
ncbi:uncharacterized protein J8A68_001228 [[Candida] subhashii]|uniref:Uncharacterized protein n=1 Tax=[Candida] subhashii TaxID=561895 RepID=A0A8J5QL97_9ASCO|nr:uncharacterized protein J8A68_001228 [[Candida] subhashii]KAG7665172.1 hypothetical protein J8A68_001228 [[Candida] subhashii]